MLNLLVKDGDLQRIGSKFIPTLWVDILDFVENTRTKSSDELGPSAVEIVEHFREKTSADRVYAVLDSMTVAGALTRTD